MQERFKEPLQIIHKLEQHGYQAYFVGGAVRDLLLNRPIGDIDIATSAKPEVVMKIFPRTIDVGAVHGTVIVLLNGTPYEVTTFRHDSEYQDFRRPTEVAFITDLREDLKRRDFTINAIAMSKDGEIIDPFNGIADIEKNIIQTVGNAQDRFNEDALRMMRALRFVSQLSFSLSKDTTQAIKENGKLLLNISIERITIEFIKLLKGKNSQKALQLLFETNIYKYLPGLRDKGQFISTISSYPFSNLDHEIEYWTLFLYHIREIESAPSFLKKWKLPKKITTPVIQNLKVLDQKIKNQLQEWTPIDLYTVGLEQAIHIEKVFRLLGNEDASASINNLQLLYDQLPIRSRSELVISGHDIMRWTERKAGPWVKNILEQIERLVINRQLQNKQDAIKEWLQSCNQK